MEGRMEGKFFNSEKSVLTVKHVGGSIMLRGCFSALGKLNYVAAVRKDVKEIFCQPGFRFPLGLLTRQ